MPSAWGTFELLTSPGPAAIAVLRLRGPLTADFVGRHLHATPTIQLEAAAPGQIRRAILQGRNGEFVDDILVSFHAAGPLWDLRLHLHGSPALVQQCTELLSSAGWQPARPAETHLWQTRDCLEAEAYALLPRVLTWRGVTWLLNQVERTRALAATLQAEESLAQAHEICRQVAARAHIINWFTTPLRVALVGPVNAGKSTLANALADRPASVVAPEPGTTRDWVEIPGELDGFPVVWLDTAGLRLTSDPLEAAGVAQTMKLLASAGATIIVLDGSAAGAAARMDFTQTYGHLRPACVALNKADIEGEFCAVCELPSAWQDSAVPVSALQRRGLNELQTALLKSAGRTPDALDAPAAWTARQVAEWRRAASASDRKTFSEIVLRIVGAPRANDG